MGARMVAGSGRAAMGPRIAERLRMATRPAFVQAAPGKFVRAPGGGAAPEFTLARWQQDEQGLFFPQPFCEHMIRLDERVVRMLGFTRQWHTIYRLGRAGFIELVRVAPGTTLINLDSYYGHLARVAEDPEFWDAGKGNLEEYRKAL